jgi:peptidoglycan-associated lipoprotein
MKIKALLMLIPLISCCLVQFGCNRSVGDTWEDTKTAGRQMGRGFRTLSGTNDESRLFRDPSEFNGPQCQQEYIPLKDDEISKQLNLEGHVPQASRTPGEPGSNLPGIDGFTDPMRSDQKRVFQNIHFDTNDHVIRGQENKKIILNISNYMQQNPNVCLFVEGHCDKRGPAAYNLALGARRSNTVRNQLVKEGVDAERIFTISYGKERPIALGDDEASLQMNRRAQFKIFAR